MALRGAFLAQLTRKPSKMLLPIMEIVYISGRIAEKLQCRLPKGANGNSGRVCFCVAKLIVSSPSSFLYTFLYSFLFLHTSGVFSGFFLFPAAP